MKWLLIAGVALGLVTHCEAASTASDNAGGCRLCGRVKEREGQQKSG
jgi:hypothetical protein